MVQVISVTAGAWHVPIIDRALKLWLLGTLDKIKHVKHYNFMAGSLLS